MMFRPTVLSVLGILALDAWMATYIPASACIPVLVLIFVTGLLCFLTGKTAVYKEVTETSYEITIETELLEEIMVLPSIQLFPEIQVELAQMAAAKYEEVGDLERATALRAEAISKMI